MPPNIDWCEQELCAWVTNPANTWSNLAYFAFGVAMLSLARRHRAAELRLFAPASFVVGVFSLVYHASYTFVFQFFDFVGMFLFCFIVITANAVRLGWIDVSRRWMFLLLGVAGFSAAVPLLSQTTIPIQSLVALLIALSIGSSACVLARGSSMGSGPQAPSGELPCSWVLGYSA